MTVILVLCRERAVPFFCGEARRSFGGPAEILLTQRFKNQLRMFR
jgi:hypothetical protein